MSPTGTGGSRSAWSTRMLRAAVRNGTPSWPSTQSGPRWISPSRQPSSAPPMSPAALSQPVRLGEVLDVDPDNGLAEAAGDLRDHRRVVVEGGRLDDRGSPFSG